MSAEQTVFEKMRQRRLQCIIHRIIYYCLGANIIEDSKYDGFERELRELIKQNPEIEPDLPYGWLCPTRFVGSSNLDSYPANLVEKARYLVRIHGIREGTIEESEPVYVNKPKPAPKVIKPPKTNPLLQMNTLFNIPKK